MTAGIRSRASSFPLPSSASSRGRDGSSGMRNDSGVVVLCDPRLVSRGYGRVFLDSLPPMPITTVIDEVTAFFASRSASEGGARSRCGREPNGGSEGRTAVER